MNKLIIILYLISINCFAESSNKKKLIDIDDYNPQEKITEPIGIVDKFGNIEWKYPPKPKEEPKKKENESKNSFIKGKDSSLNLEINASLIGQLTGANMLVYYQNNKLSYGGSLKYFKYSSIDETSFSNMMGTFLIQYHFMPRWYTNSPNHKNFDLGISMNLGYNLVGKSETNTTIKSSPIISLGAFSSLPISENIHAIIRLDNFSTGSKALGSSATIGISYSFK